MAKIKKTIPSVDEKEVELELSYKYKYYNYLRK